METKKGKMASTNTMISPELQFWAFSRTQNCNAICENLPQSENLTFVVLNII